MRVRKHFIHLLGCVPAVLAAVKFTSPAPGAIVPGATFTVTWIDDGNLPSISDLAGYTLELGTGSNSVPVSNFHTYF
jgi:hypothetical protein